MPESTSPVVIGVDIGGTFTDLCLRAPDGRVVTAKLPSTPADYSQAVAQALETAFAAAPDSLGHPRSYELVHGSTIATNAVLERKGARTALLTTAGFRDVLELRRLRMPQLYNLQWEKPAPLVPRSLRLEVTERVGARGEILCPLDEEQVRRHGEWLRGERVESIAVCLINAYANPSHEQRVKALLSELLQGVPISLSTEIIREIGEFERTSTSVVNAYVRPAVDRYLKAIEGQLEPAGGRLLVMQSNGAVMPAGAARERPCYLIESGPAAGVIAGQAVAEALGLPDLVTLDMGGTTAKAALIESGEISFVDEYEIGGGITLGSRLMKGDGYLLRIPAIDLAEVGAGGGSLAFVDAGGALQVGPRSVGADPGPACYGRGTTQATITDANLVLGYINPERFAGGALQLRPDLAREALERLGRQLGLDAAAAAHAVHIVGNTRMARAIRAVSTERGHDVRKFTLLAFGGSGPLHAAQLARSLGIRRVVVPPHPGVFSALGLLCAPAGYQFVQTYKARLDQLADDELAVAVAALVADGQKELERLGYPGGEAHFGVEADLRYAGQHFRVRVALPDFETSRPVGLTVALRERFEAEYQRRYGHHAEGAPVELVGFHLTARVRQAAPLLDLAGVDGRGAEVGLAEGSRPACFSRDEGFLTTRVLRRADLAKPVPGPALVEEDDTTIVIPPGCEAVLDERGNVVITLEG